MESEVPSEIVKVYYPNINDFQNFKKYIEAVEKDVYKFGGVKAAKVRLFFLPMLAIACKI